MNYQNKTQYLLLEDIHPFTAYSLSILASRPVWQIVQQRIWARALLQIDGTNIYIAFNV